MTGLWGQPRAAGWAEVAPAALPDTGLGENLAASWDSAISSDVPWVAYERLREAYDPLVEALNAARDPDAPAFINPYGDSTAAAIAQAENEGNLLDRIAGWTGGTTRAEIRDQFERRIWAELPDLAGRDPGTFGNLPQDRDALIAPLRARAEADQAEAAAVGGRATGWGQVGGFLGATGAQFADPITAGSVFVGAGAGVGVARTMAIEALIGGGVELARLPALARSRALVGRTLSGADARANVLFGAAGGGLFGGAIAALARGGRASFGLAQRVRERGSPATDAEIVAAAEADADVLTPGQRAATAAFADEAATRAANPLPDTAPGRTLHQQRADTAFEAALAALDPTRLDELLSARPAVEIARAEGAVAGGYIHVFNPRDIGREPTVFQFKSDTDAGGVNQALASVQRWDPVKAGQVVVFEYANGVRVIADGHQRHALALRLAGPGGNDSSGQPVRLLGQLFREVDGYTPQQVRAIAAVKNLAEGTGSTVDAAKILRDAPELIDQSLAVGRERIRQATELTALSDEAFGLVWNEVVPAHYAALVGRLIADDPVRQMAALDALAKLKPDNATQAESIVRQVLAEGAELIHQDSLFGEEILATALFRERAQIMDAALRRLRQDRATFNTLVQRRGAIEGAGNRLDPATNARRAQDDAIAIEIIQGQANRAGTTINAAIRAAARQRADGGDLRGSVDGFVVAVRDAIARGDLDRVEPGAAGRGGEAAGEGGTDAGRPAAGAAARADDRLEQFDPAADGTDAAAAAQADSLLTAARRQLGDGPASERTDQGEQTLIDGVRPVTDGDRARAAANRPLRGGDAAADFGLFDGGAQRQSDIADLLADPEQAVPVGTLLDDAGETAPQVVGLRELVDEIDADQDFLEQLGVCKP